MLEILKRGRALPRKSKHQRDLQGRPTEENQAQSMKIALPAPLNEDPQIRAAREIVFRLSQSGYQAYFVGGFVRALALETFFGAECKGALSAKNREIDIATNASPTQIAQIFGDVHFVGQVFGVSLVDISGFRFELATFRQEGPYSDKRRPDFIQLGTFYQDSCRRDFTVNALYWDPVHEDMFDFHNGIADLKAQRIKTVGKPQDRFQEDSLRILRMCRFASALGFHVEDETWKAAQSAASQLTHLSRERVLAEFGKTPSESLVGFLDLLRRMGADQVLWDVGFQLATLEKLASLRAKDSQMQALLMNGFPLTIVCLAAWPKLRGVSESEVIEKWRQWEAWPALNADRRNLKNLIQLLNLCRQPISKMIPPPCGFKRGLLAIGLLEMTEKLSVFSAQDLAVLFQDDETDSLRSKENLNSILVEILGRMTSDGGPSRDESSMSVVSNVSMKGLKLGKEFSQYSRQEVVDFVTQNGLQSSLIRLLIGAVNLYNLMPRSSPLSEDIWLILDLMGQDHERLNQLAQEYLLIVKRMNELQST